VTVATPVVIPIEAMASEALERRSFFGYGSMVKWGEQKNFEFERRRQF
jgi:hypothetical protein